MFMKLWARWLSSSDQGLSEDKTKRVNLLHLHPSPVLDVNKEVWHVSLAQPVVRGRTETIPLGTQRCPFNHLSPWTS